MIVFISPAKSMDFQSKAPFECKTIPHFLKNADYLAGKLSKLKPSQLEELMHISPKLALLNAERFANWKTAEGKQAIYAYDGDVYVGLQAKSLPAPEIDFAQKHLRILSGLYGVLRPLDIIKPYRIEMSTPFETPKGKSLYDYWDKKITSLVKKDLMESENDVIINLASQEYFAALQVKNLKSRIITPVFKDKSNGNYAVVSFFAKKARGMMCRFIIQNKITDFEMLVGFDEGGYHFNHGLSKGDNWVFTRG